jgi:hypothetical protein
MVEEKLVGSVDEVFQRYLSNKDKPPYIFKYSMISVHVVIKFILNVGGIPTNVAPLIYLV